MAGQDLGYHRIGASDEGRDLRVGETLPEILLLPPRLVFKFREDFARGSVLILVGTALNCVPTGRAPGVPPIGPITGTVELIQRFYFSAEGAAFGSGHAATPANSVRSQDQKI